MSGVHQRTDSDMEVRERKRLEQVVKEAQDDINHIRANIATLKARKYDKQKLIEKIKEMLR